MRQAHGNSGIGAIVLMACLASTIGRAATIEAAREPATRQDVETLNQQYEKLFLEGRYAQAIPLAKEACSILEAELGERAEEFILCLSNLAVLHERQDEYVTAVSLHKRVLRLKERTLGSNHPDVASTLRALAAVYKKRGEYKSAETLYKRALSIKEKALGRDHPDVGNALNSLATLYYHQGRYAEAQPLYERALSNYEKTLGPDNLEVAAILNNLAELHRATAAYDSAEPLYQRALAIEENALGSDHFRVATTLNNLGLLYHDQGLYDLAEPLYARSLAIRERTFGPDHLHVAQSLANLAALHRDQGRYDDAELLQERERSIKKNLLGINHFEYAQCLYNLAELHFIRGNYRESEVLYEEALLIFETTLGPDHPNVAAVLNNLSLLHQAQGEYERAKLLQRRAIAVWMIALGPDHPSIALGLNNLGVLHQRQDDHETAERLHHQALGIFEKTLGATHPHVAMSLGNLAVTSEMKGDYERAEGLHRRAINIRKDALGLEHPDVAYNLGNLAVLYRKLGRHGESEPLLKQALAIRVGRLGPDHLDVALSLSALGVLYVDLGKYDSARDLFKRALDIEEKNLTNILAYVEDQRRMAFAATLSDSIDTVLSSHLQTDAPSPHPLAELALTAVLRRKGRVFDLGTRSIEVIRRSLPEEHQHLLGDLSAARDRYAALTNRDPGRITSGRFSQQLAENQKEQQELWHSLTDLSNVAKTLFAPVTIGEVQRTLPADSVLVEFIRYRPRFDNAGHSTPKAGPPRYAAYIVFPDHFDWVDVGLAAPIDEHIEAFRKALQLRQAIPTDLDDVIMQPIVERVGRARRLFISPDADLNVVPFGALYDGERYLVERYELHYLTTGRDLLRPWDANPTMTNDAVTVVANPTGARLPGTEYEAELLEEIFPHVEVLLHDVATEANAQRRARPWALHLATHGFFEASQRNSELEARMDEHALSMSPSVLPFYSGRLDNPMLHSGLLLASTGLKDTTPDDVVLDEHLSAAGRVTAYEISGWDLRGTELVVLSACGTGLGESRAGEGVLGLRRAVAMAGAQTLVMSLWDVSDATTAKLMEAYYRKLLTGRGRAEAMQEVQLEMLRSGEYHPGEWASFVVVGEWRPLSKEHLSVKPEGPRPVDAHGCGCQRASIAGSAQPSLVVLALLGLLAPRRRGHRIHRPR